MLNSRKAFTPDDLVEGGIVRSTGDLTAMKCYYQVTAFNWAIRATLAGSLSPELGCVAISSGTDTPTSTYTPLMIYTPTSTHTPNETAFFTPTFTATPNETYFASPTPTLLPGDLNGDRQVNESDLLGLIRTLEGATGGQDVNSDAMIDYKDVFSFSLWWSQRQFE